MQNEVKSCLECASRGGIFQEIGTDWPMCPCCKTIAPATVMPRQYWETRDQFIARAFAEMEASNAVLLVSAPVEAAPAKARCPHYAVVREFAAVAREKGLSMSDKDCARLSMSVFLGVRIESRAQLTAGQWHAALRGLRRGLFFW